MVFAKGKRSAVGPTAVSRRTCWILADSQGFSPSKDIKCDNLFKTADHGQYSAKIYHMLPKHLPAVESLTPAVREVSVGLWIEWLLSHSSRKGVLFNGCFALVRKMCEGEKSPVTGVFSIPFKCRPTETPVMHSGAQKASTQAPELFPRCFPAARTKSYDQNSAC